MKKVLTLLVMVLAFNLSNAQTDDNQNDGFEVNPFVGVNAGVFLNEDVNEVSPQVEFGAIVENSTVSTSLSALVGRGTTDNMFGSEDDIQNYFVGLRASVGVKTDLVTPYVFFGGSQMLVDGMTIQVNSGAGVMKEFNRLMVSAQYERLFNLDALTLKLGLRL